MNRANDQQAIATCPKCKQTVIYLKATGFVCPVCGNGSKGVNLDKDGKKVAN